MIAQFLINSIKLPNVLISIAFFTKKALFWIFVEPTTVSKVTQSEPQEGKDQVVKKETDSKCNFCNKCSDCEKLDGKEVKKKKEKTEKESNVAALNYFAFIVLFLVIFSCDMAIWISIGA